MTLPILNGLNYYNYNNNKNARQRRIPLLWIAVAFLLGLYAVNEASFSSFFMKNNKSSSNAALPESLVVYDWKDPELGARKQHMELVHMETEVTRRRKNNYYFPIDQVHHNGMVHTGVWVAVLDTNVTSSANAKILLLKRGPQLKTCPNTWSLMGEHTYRDEKPKETVLRGLKEELGDSLVAQFLKVGSMKPVLKDPAMFHLDYHDDKGRRERQITYLYVIEMNTPLAELQTMLKVDDEVAQVAWMTRQELQDDWLNLKPNEKFCHHEMIVFIQLMLHRLEDMGKEAMRDAPPR